MTRILWKMFHPLGLAISLPVFLYLRPHGWDVVIVGAWTILAIVGARLLLRALTGSELA